MVRPRSWTAAFLVAALAGGCGSGEKVREGRRFPPGFLFGASTAAQQCEGGLTNNDWSQFEDLGRVPPSGVGDRAYDLFASDADLMARLHLNAYRFSIEWSRVEPSPGVWDAEAIAHYHAAIGALRARGIVPVVTLYHWTLPRWVQNLEDPPAGLGGWRNPAVQQAFADFAGKMAEEYGKDVDLWITFNEPIGDTLAGYVLGVFPPGLSNLGDPIPVASDVLRGMLNAHALAYRALHARDVWSADPAGPPARVTIANNTIAFYPARPTLDRVATREWEQLWDRTFPDALVNGRFDPGLLGYGPAEDHPEWRGTLDLLGVNFYSYEPVVTVELLPPLRGLPCDQVVPGAFRVLGCPVHNIESSRGLAPLLEKLYGWWGLPILITENGTVTEDGKDRSLYIARHLWALTEAMRAGVPVLGYLHWTLFDDYEWNTGYSIDMGLYGIDRKDPARARLWRPGTEIYGDIARTGILPGAVVDQAYASLP